MAYIDACALVCRALQYNDLTDFDCVDSGSGIDLSWYHADPQPTEQQVSDYATDVTPLPNTQLFSEWQAEHGGDPVATVRRQAKEALDKQASETEQLIRALALVVLDEINALRAQHSLPARTPAQLRNAIKNKITAGDADT